MSRGAGIVSLLGSLGLLPNFLASRDASLVPGLTALVRPAHFLAIIPATIPLVSLVVASGRKCLVVVAFSTFLSHVPLVSFT